MRIPKDFESRLAVLFLFVLPVAVSGIRVAAAQGYACPPGYGYEPGYGCVPATPVYAAPQPPVYVEPVPIVPVYDALALAFGGGERHYEHGRDERGWDEQGRNHHDDHRGDWHDRR